jgi:YbgC/YbaW family acyl-CoA thioester hydrolase
VEQTLPRELQSSAVVRFQDCDPFQHLNNARYLDYFLNAREDQLVKFYNFSIFEHSKTTNQGWVVTKTHIAYFYPAGIMESLVIKTRLIHMTESTLVIEGIMFDKDLKRPKSLVWMEFTYVSMLTGRTVSHADELMQLFTTVVDGDTYQPDGFNQRAETLKREYRKRPLESAVGITV